MTNAVLTRLAAERADLIAFVDETLSRAAEAGRDLVDAEQANLSSTQERIALIDAQMAPLARFEEVRQSAVRIDSITDRPTQREHEQRQNRDASQSLGALITGSEQYRGYNGSSSSFGRLELADVDTRALLVESADPGKSWLPSPQKYVAPAAALRTPLLDVITRVPVSTSSVDILVYGAEPTGAAVVKEGEDKPEVIFTASSVPTPLDTIAGWVKSTRQLMQDAPAARQLIDSGLTRSVLKALQAEVVKVVKAASIASTTGAAKAPLLNVVREGMAVVEGNGFVPDILVANPKNIAQLDLTVLGGTLLGPALQSNYWGLRPVAVPGLADGDIYVMDGSEAIALFERMGVEVYMTDSDISGTGATIKSDFRANIITTLAEVRAKAAVVNAAAATKLVVTP